MEIALKREGKNVKRETIGRALVLVVLAAAVFLGGFYFGRTGTPGTLSVTTQYEIGAVAAQEVERLEAQLARRAENPVEQPGREYEPEQGDTETHEAPSDDSGLININTASVDELIALPGIGPTLAERIINHRERYGSFRIIEQITDVSGIGEQRFADIQFHITV